MMKKAPSSFLHMLQSYAVLKNKCEKTIKIVVQEFMQQNKCHKAIKLKPWSHIHTYGEISTF